MLRNACEKILFVMTKKWAKNVSGMMEETNIKEIWFFENGIDEWENNMERSNIAAQDDFYLGVPEVC